jgi:hypothetical protein
MNPNDNQTPPTQNPQPTPVAPPDRSQTPVQPSTSPSSVPVETPSQPSFGAPTSAPSPMPGPEPVTVGAAPSTGKKIMVAALVVVVLAIAGVLIWLVLAPK